MGEKQEWQTAQELLQNLVGERCWSAGVAREAGNSLGLHFGRRLRLRIEHPRFEGLEFGSIHFIVWCSWRLQNAEGIVISHDEDADETYFEHLSALKGQRVTGVELRKPCGDLTLHFENGLAVAVFCDFVGETASFSINWEMRCGDHDIEVLKGGEVRISDSDTSHLIEAQPE